MAEQVIRFLRRGGAVSVVMSMLVLALLAYIGTRAWTGTVPRPRTAAIRRDPLPPTQQDLAVTLTRLGLDAEPLAAAGFTTQEVTALVGRVSTHLQGNIQTIRDADANWASARKEVDRLEALVRSGLSTEQDRTAYLAAQNNLVTATSNRQAALDAVLSASGNGVAAEKMATLAAMRNNHGQWDLQTAYLAGSHTEPDWVNLRDALANDRISAAHGEPPDPAAHQVIVSAAADPAVAAASTNLSNNGPAITEAWNSAVFH